MGSDLAEDYARDWDRRRRDAALYGLVTVGLIDAATDQAMTVHPVVADVNRSRLLTAPRRELYAISSTAVTLLHACCQGLDVRRPAHWPTWRNLVPHATALLGWLSPHLGEDDLATLVEAAAMITTALWRGGNYATAERLARASLKAVSGLSTDHPASLTARSQLAHVIAVTRYDEAEKMFRKILEDQRCILGDLHPDTMFSRRVLARLAGLRGRYRQAEQMYRRLIADCQHRLDGDHEEILHLRHGLAGMVERLGRFEEAESMFRALHDDQRRILGDDHQECLELRSGIGRPVEDQQRYAEAEQLYRHLLADRERVLGGDHPSTLNTRHSLARVVAAQGDLDEAEKLYQGLFADRQRILGDDHPLTIATREFLTKMREDSSLAGQPGIARMEALMYLPHEHSSE